ncbi:cytochrome c biogenesis CcdA family protein [Achromobacter xylosoxidans]|jgi:cytochrome c biogenesis protein CcdA|uniref:cytochrome c biogenesis CcdA family protein n=1 Tax=Alcaligenes xylosoxydans xylosoxydans TaxID=85698 RepID=UPI00071D0D8D|nr:cytochrome c biogenesis CcdA family protein [Achromobacter xylosoxidans]MDH0519507.1 cytochrome c biogenesis CcdA family protein [Achromobacter xylosoxidans]MDH0543671.1 cytochrome c biogenesis CcdA family protein [Achromobacter xylosoxidans]QKQ54405.1 cytochrome c biogenesis protein CcdA [Achromobacter xylosoxidans]QPR96441.1 cytochrome c biogenesis protein CcdA [Achromobacter xylosoxidans]UON40382.1 cytochrome c biogenesis protein CcdA [Achromobacter xylosoxidans]
MTLGLGSYGFGLLAGVVSTLSPCVLPIVPILIGSAINSHRHGPLVLAAGLALSYAIVGTALVWAGASLGIDTTIFRGLGATVLGLLGVVLMFSALQQRFSSLTSGIGNAGNNLLSRIQLDGLPGQFVVGLVLGVVWSPCVGPTLGAAIVLASQGTNLAQAGSMMAVFGVGAALPLVALAYVSRTALGRTRSKLVQAGKVGKVLMGAVMLALAVLILTGADKLIEAWLVEHSPAWLTRLTTRF